MLSFNKNQFTSIDAATRDLVASKSYETLDSGRYMVNVAVSPVHQDIIREALWKSPRLEKLIIAGKKNHPTDAMILTITQSTKWAHVNAIAVKNEEKLSPKAAADLLGELNNATPLKMVPFLVAPQFDWLVNWACTRSGSADPNDQSTKYSIPTDVADIVNGLFKNTEVVVILNIHEGDNPFRIRHACISELKIVDGKLVPNFSE